MASGHRSFRLGLEIDQAEVNIVLLDLDDRGADRDILERRIKAGEMPPDFLGDDRAFGLGGVRSQMGEDDHEDGARKAVEQIGGGEVLLDNAPANLVDAVGKALPSPLRFKCQTHRVEIDEVEGSGRSGSLIGEDRANAPGEGDGIRRKRRERWWCRGEGAWRRRGAVMGQPARELVDLVQKRRVGFVRLRHGQGPPIKSATRFSNSDCRNGLSSVSSAPARGANARRSMA